jgi:hypothetical protein
MLVVRAKDGMDGLLVAVKTAGAKSHISLI